METVLYTIVRFAPFSETGEFANIGIVGSNAPTNFFGFKVQSRKYARVTKFFSAVEPQIYRTAVANLQTELFRMKRLTNFNAKQLSLNFGNKAIAVLLLQELLRKKEGVIRFSDIRMSVTSDPEAEVERLYKYYVEKDFVTPQYVEQLLEKSIRSQLKALSAEDRFVEMKLTDGPYQARFPFVRMANGAVTGAIKPISLSQERPEAIIEHANKWSYALRRLKKAGVLPSSILLPAKMPDSGAKRAAAYHEAAAMLLDAGGYVVSEKDTNALKDYIRLQ
jgi:Protein of unknown function (DUF3037)